MKKFLLSLSFILVVGLMLIGCEADDATERGTEVAPTEVETETDIVGNGNEETLDIEPLHVLASFSVIADMIEHVGGRYVVVTTIVPIGEEPEEYEFTPGDVDNAILADVIFYNGFGLEHEYDWFETLMATANREKDVDFFAVSDGLAAVRLMSEGLEDYYDPHLWMDPLLGMGYVDNIVAVLSSVRPEVADYFVVNGEAFNAEIYAIYTAWSGRFNEVTDERNLLVTTEGAFRYFGYRFNVNTDFVWEFNSEDEGTPEQFIRIIDIINESGIRYLFLESSIEPDYMEQVSRETGLPIFDAYLFTDSLSEANGPAATYLAFLRHNLETIYAGLTAE